MDTLFIVASNVLRTRHYLGPSANPIVFETEELVNIEEQPWEQLEASIAATIMSREAAVKLRVAGHMKCFRPDTAGDVEQVFPSLADSLTRRLGEMTPLNTEVWGFKHVEDSRIWSALSGVAKVLHDDPADPKKKAFAQQLRNAFLEPAQVRLNEGKNAPHLFMRPATVTWCLENAARALNSQDPLRAQEWFAKARREMSQNIADAQRALATLRGLVNRCQNPELRRESESVIEDLDHLLNLIPDVEGSHADEHNLRGWATKASKTLDRLPKDLLT